MAIYHLTTKVFSRGKGQSAIAAAAYRSGQRLVDEAVGEQKFYNSRANRIEFEGMFVPSNAPDWARDRNAFWNRAEKTETRKDGRLAREIEVSLPHELTDQQRLNLVKDFVREAFVRKGYAADVAIHAPDRQSDDRNHHAHILISERKLSADGFAAKKDPVMNGKAQLGEWREQWAHLANRYLERHGHDVRIDHRSLSAQGVDREATVHVGYAGLEMAERGAQSDRMDALKEILARNDIRVDLRRDMQSIEGELKELGLLQQREERIKVDQSEPERRQGEEQAAKQAAAAAELARRQAAPEPIQAPQEVQTPQAPAIAPKANQQDPAVAAQDARRDHPGAHTPDIFRPIEKGLRVFDSATGTVSSLGDFMVGLLAGPSAPPRSDMKAFVTDPAARKEQQLARLAAIQNEREAAVAVERIARDVEQGKNLNAQDVRKLTHQHQEQIRTFGDTAVQQMVDEARKRSESYWKGNERERER
ncbi:MAG: MobQ family relaxase [Bradyrhizobium sp.]|nr:MobQ family relaxase [Bradyrhizobium sp.]